MFWVKFNDIRPWLSQQQIFVNDDNNLPTATYDDFFTLNMYSGDIYKTRNLKNKSMVQLYPDADARKAAQDSIDNRLKSFDKKLWVPDREEILAAKAAKEKGKDKKEVAQVDENTENPAEAVTEQPKEETTAKRATKRTSSNNKKSKVKETKIKSNSSNAVRSVRRRK